MPSFKSDSSFFHKIAMGAIGSRTVRSDLAEHGHDIIELERGSLDAKIWKDVKRKRVRIPDLVCRRCGQRIEVRAKSEPKLSMSHSPTVVERRWDYGMVDTDLIAIPICSEVGSNDSTIKQHWMRGMLTGETSYWNEREWVLWRPDGMVNYFTVQAFRDARPDRVQKKGAEEGSETTLIWRACFSPCDGTIVDISPANITIESAEGMRRRRGRKEMDARVAIGDFVRQNQILACNAEPAASGRMQCTGELNSDLIRSMLGSPHLPVRFAGVKLARSTSCSELLAEITSIASDRDEDVYVRLEAKAYLAQMNAYSIAELFAPELSAMDRSDQLEAVIAIGEVGNENAAVILAGIIGDESKGYFLRSAAAYCLGRIDSSTSRRALVNAFSAQSYRVREDALTALADVGFDAMPELVSGIDNDDEQIQAGSAEVLRWLARRADTASVSSRLIPEVAQTLTRADRPLIAAWLGGQLPEPLVRAAIGDALENDVRLGYSLAVSWAFARSWIAPLHDTFLPPRL